MLLEHWFGDHLADVAVVLNDVCGIAPGERRRVLAPLEAISRVCLIGQRGRAVMATLDA